jgi:hypothetical protein
MAVQIKVSAVQQTGHSAVMGAALQQQQPKMQGLGSRGIKGMGRQCGHTTLHGKRVTRSERAVRRGVLTGTAAWRMKAAKVK